MFQTKFIRALFSSLMFLLSFGLANADDKNYPERPNPPRLVNDFAGILSADNKRELEVYLEDYARATSNQITIVTISSLQGIDILDYSHQLFGKWGLGDKEKNNGLLILLAMDNGEGKKKASIQVGNGLQGAIPDITCNDIIEQQMIPQFKNGNYYQGLKDASGKIMKLAAGEYHSDRKFTEEDRRGHGKKKNGIGTGFIILLIIIALVSRINRGGGRGGGGGGGWVDFASGMLLGNMMGRGWGNGGGSSGGGGSWDGVGDFGGFGGGSSDGGGASGDW